MGYMEDISKEQEYDKFFNATLRYITRSMKTEFEVKKYLERKKASRKDIAKIISKLKEYKYIDDVEYAKYFAQIKVRSGMGSFAISYELHKRGVDKDTSKKVLAEVFEDVDEREMAKEIALKKAEKLVNYDAKKKLSRISSFLRRKGFSEDIIYNAMEPIINMIKEEE
jgi:regulatory protein